MAGAYFNPAFQRYAYNGRCDISRSNERRPHEKRSAEAWVQCADLNKQFIKYLNLRSTEVSEIVFNDANLFNNITSLYFLEVSGCNVPCKAPGITGISQVDNINSQFFIVTIQTIP